jgi:tRNA (cytidine/uridine-2'-O-)-methyltransferase
VSPPLPQHPEPRFHVALLQPEIGPNAGNAGRLCLGLGARLHLIHPLGFKTDEKAVRRAGLDYWADVDLVEHPDVDHFFGWLAERPLFLFSAEGAQPYSRCPFVPGCVLLFGRESVGLPRELIRRHGAWKIPTPGPVRSLNLSNAIAVVGYAALARLEPELF